MDETTDDFAAVLRRMRRAAALTQEELAEASGLSVEGISALERGERRRPHARTVDLLIRGLGLDDDTGEALRSAGRPARRTSRDRTPRVTVRVPRQLLAPPATYVGRADTVERLAAALSDPTSRRTPARLAVTGMGGVGKSSLALLVAHRSAEHYPDGQLYLDLRGHGGEQPMPIMDALTFLLTSLGVNDREIGTDPDQAAAQLRTLTSSARVLLVLDNAAGPAQVTPLLPSSSSSGVIITSRHTLSDLVDVEHHSLDLLDDTDAEHLLGELIGADRLEAEPDAAAVLTQACAGLPLALRMVGARLRARPTWPVSLLAEQVNADLGRLGDLGGEVDVATTLLGSIDQLVSSADPRDHDAAAAMHIVGLLPVPQVSPTAVAAACGWSVRRAEAAIARLAEVSLVEEPAPGRYRAHDLVHAVASDRAREEAGLEAQREVRVRVLQAYRSVAWASRALTRPDAPELEPVLGEDCPDPVAGLDLVDRDIEQIVALVRDIARTGDERTLLVAHTVLGLSSYYLSRADSSGWRALLDLALGSLPDEATHERIWLRVDLALHLALRGQVDGALTEVREVLDAAAASELNAASAAAHSAAMIAWRRHGDLDEAEAACAAALQAAEASGQDRVRAAAYRDLGLLRFSNGEVERGLAATDQSLQIYRRLDVPRGVCMALINAGVMLRELGRMAPSRQRLEEAVEISRTVTDHALEAEALDELGYWHVLAGEPERGLEMLTQGLALVDVRGGDNGAASLRHRLALAFDGLGRTTEADEHWDAAIRLHEERGENDVAAALRRQYASRSRPASLSYAAGSTRCPDPPRRPAPETQTSGRP